MNKSQLESKHLAELHDLAAEKGVERYRMLSRAELIEKLAGGNGKAASKPQGGGRGGESRRRKPRERKPRGRGEQRQPREQRESRQEPPREPEPAAAPPTPPPGAAVERPKRKRRRRWGRRRKGGGIREHADRWREAWNARDLDEIVSCYSEQVEFVLPALVSDDEERRINGREELREHFRHGLELAPNLTVDEESLLVGPSGFAILYRREDGHRAIETVELDADGLASRARVYYERD